MTVTEFVLEQAGE